MRVDESLIAEGIGENLYLGHLYSEYRTYQDPNGRTRCEFDWLTTEQIADKVVVSWIQSSTHRANLLSGIYRAHAIGVATGANGTVFLTQNLSPVSSGSQPIALLAN